jgi:hypothetical protein
MVIIQLLIYVRAESFEIFKLEIFVITGTVVLTYFVTNYLTRDLRFEINEGKKKIVFKEIQEKFDFLDKQDRFSPEIKKYVIIANSQKFLLTEEQYQTAEISDYLAVHMTPLRELTIKVEILKKTCH